MKKLLIVVAVLVSTLLQADFELKYNMGEDKQTYRYKDSKHSKIITIDEEGKSEIVKNKKSIYMVSYKNDGGIDVLDMIAMKRMASQSGFDTSGYMQKSKKPNFKIKKTSKKVKVGGIKGEVWILSDADYPSEKGQKIVVTNDKNVVKAVKSMFSLYSEFGGVNMDNAYLEPKKGFVIIKAPDMELEYYKNTKVSASEFKIPKGQLGKSKDDNWGDSNTKITNTPKAKLKCFDSVCCSKPIGASVVLKNALPKTMNVPGDFVLVQSATCSRTKDSASEAAIYISPSELSRIYVELKINTKSKGIIKESGSYSERKSGKYKIYSATFEDIKQEVADVAFENNSLLTFARLKTENQSYFKWIDQYVIWSGVTKNNSKLSKGIKNYNFSKDLVSQKQYDKNYKNIICNGSHRSASKILAKHTKQTPKHGFVGFKLFDVAKCDGKNTEEAIFIRRNGYETYKVVVNLDDHKGGVIKNKPRHDVKNYHTGSHYGDTYEGSYDGVFYSDYDLGNGVSVSFSKKEVSDPLVEGFGDLNGISMYSNIDIAGLMAELNPDFKNSASSSNHPKKHNEYQKNVGHSSSRDKSSIDDAVAKEATKLFKSFF